MRIGELEDIENTENSENLIRLIQSEKQRHLHGVEKWKNWWYYYKWYVLCGVILIGIAISWLGNALGLWQPAPDFQIAYVGEAVLPEDTVNALENALAALGEDLELDLDFNQDGKIIVKINQYPANSQIPDNDAHYYETAAEISLIGDISDGDTVDLYDAQLYLLLSEFTSAEKAQENMDAWLDRARSNYEISAEADTVCNEQAYLMITYTFPDENTPYARGVSAFAVHGNSAVCMELTCQEDFAGDLETILTEFLENCSYSE